MARNAEKAQSTLARFAKAKQAALIGSSNERPYLASECHDLKDAEKFRMQVIREAARKISQIQNPGLGEFRIRDLNDEINKNMREKKHWQERIIELGGPNYFKVGPKMLDYEGKEVPGDPGYRYFGAARDLPGVRELFEQTVPDKARVTRGQLAKKIDADYYGFRDDEDGELQRLEAKVEGKARQEAQDEWANHEKNGTGPFREGYVIESRYGSSKYSHNAVDADAMEVDADGEGEDKPVSYAEVPSQDDVKQQLMMHRKQELLQRYASEHLQGSLESSKKIVG